MDEKLLEELKNLETSLVGKNKEEIKALVDAFKSEFGTEMKEAAKVQETKMAEMQKHLNTMDIKVNAPSFGTKSDAPVDEIKSAITKNAEAISEVRTGKSLELKVVGNMTLANITGDEMRDYSTDVKMANSQAVNFADLVGIVNISGGTYTFPQENIPAGEGAFAMQTEGAAKAQLDYDLTMIDSVTNFLAGTATYSKKMANNVPFLESYLPKALRRDYFKAENAKFYGELKAAATASALIVGTIVERIINEQTTLMALDYFPNAIAVSPKSYGQILLSAGATGGTAGTFSLPGVVTVNNGVVSLNGMRLIVASWVTADEYIIGEWAQADKVSTQGLGLEFSTENADNFTKNNITARMEAQISLAVYRPNAFIAGDFTTIA